MSSSVVCVCHAAQSTLQCVVCDRAGVTCVRLVSCECVWRSRSSVAACSILVFVRNRRRIGFSVIATAHGASVGARAAGGEVSPRTIFLAICVVS